MIYTNIKVNDAIKQRNKEIFLIYKYYPKEIINNFYASAFSNNNNNRILFNSYIKERIINI